MERVCFVGLDLEGLHPVGSYFEVVGIVVGTDCWGLVFGLVVGFGIDFGIELAGFGFGVGLILYSAG